MDNRRNKCFDFIRGLAMIFVVYTHLIGSTIYANSDTGGIPIWIGKEYNYLLPLYDGFSKKVLIYPSEIFYFKMFTSLAIVGVIWFYILAGYFSVNSINKFKGGFKYILHRGIRLYPIFFIAMIIDYICITKLGASKEITMINLLASFIIFNSFLGIETIATSNWALQTIVFYDLICSFFKTINFKNVLKIHIFLILLIFGNHFLNAYIPNSNILFIFTKRVLTTCAYLGYYVNFVLLGGVLNLCDKGDAEKNKSSYLQGYLPFIYLLISTWLLSQVMRTISIDATEYTTTTAFYCAFSLFFIIKYIGDKCPSFFEKKCFAPIYFFSDNCFTIYMIHCGIGFNLMLFMKKIGINQNIYLWCGIITPLLLAYILSKLVEKPIVRWGKKYNL